MMIKIVPTFTSQFDEVGGKLPGITLAVMAVSDFFVHTGILLLPSSQGLPYLSMRGKRQRVGHIYWENLF